MTDTATTLASTARRRISYENAYRQIMEADTPEGVDEARAVWNAIRKEMKR